MLDFFFLRGLGTGDASTLAVVTVVVLALLGGCGLCGLVAAGFSSLSPPPEDLSFELRLTIFFNELMSLLPLGPIALLPSETSASLWIRGSDPSVFPDDDGSLLGLG